MASRKNNNRNNSNNNDYTKKTGCNLYQRVDHEKGLFMTVWRVDNGKVWKGKITMTPSQRKTGIKVSKNRKEWVSVILRMTAPMENERVTTGLLDLSNYKVYFNDWNMIANPKARNGGYFGKHISKNYDN